MNFFLATFNALLSLQTAMCTSSLAYFDTTLAGSIANSPFVTPVSAILPAIEQTNTILQKFNVSVINPANPVDTANISLYERVCPDGQKTLVMQLLPPLVAGAYPQPGDKIQVSLSVKEEYVAQSATPLSYILMAEPSTAFDSTTVLNSTTFDYVFTCPTNYYSAIINIAELGYAYAATYTLNNTDLSYSLTSDVFCLNPVIGTYTAFSSVGVQPENITLPNNKSEILARIRKSLKEAIVRPSVPETQVRQMAVSLYLEEIGSLFRKTECEKKTTCSSSSYADYTAFVCSAIKAIAYCNQDESGKFDFTLPVCGGFGINRELVQCSKRFILVDVTVDIEIYSLFNEAFIAETYSPISDYPSGLKPIPIESSESESESEVLMKPIQQAKKQQKPVAKKVKTKTTVSTYGWYIAGGVVAVSVAVVVYVALL
ncbi:hypothetical protein GINT2_000917 [Glugoides intestinalis]